MEYTDGIYAVLLRKWYAQHKNCKFSSSSPKASRLCGWLPRVQSILPSSSVHAGIILVHDLMHIIFTSMNFLQFFPALLKHKKRGVWLTVLISFQMIIIQECGWLRNGSKTDYWSAPIDKHVALHREQWLCECISSSMLGCYRGRLAHSCTVVLARTSLGCGKKRLHSCTKCMLPWSPKLASARPWVPLQQVNSHCTCSCLWGTCQQLYLVDRCANTSCSLPKAYKLVLLAISKPTQRSQTWHSFTLLHDKPWTVYAGTSKVGIFVGVIGKVQRGSQHLCWGRPSREGHGDVLRSSNVWGGKGTGTNNKWKGCKWYQQW